jgi:phosphatidylserine decarboxylase precursor
MLNENQVDLEKVCIEFKTFNNFFSRGMAAGRRPNLIPNGAGRVEADAATGKAPLISCADSRVMAYETIKYATTFWVKEKEFTLSTFLGNNLPVPVTIECRDCHGNGICAHEDASVANCKKWRLAGGHKCVPCKTCNSWKGKFDYSEQIKEYANGLLTPNGKSAKYEYGPSMVIFRLAPQDYHRFHYAVSGTIVDHYAIQGKLYSVNPAAINAESYRVFQENQRYVTVIQTANGKMVYAIPVGAAMVGSIVFQNDDGTSTVKKGDKIEAGQMHGKMRFGGSTVVYLFEDGVVDFDEDLKKRCIGNWKEKVPCPSTCIFSKIWEEHRNDPAKLKQALRCGETAQHSCSTCSGKGFVRGKEWPMMESYYQAGELMGTTTYQSTIPTDQ